MSLNRYLHPTLIQIYLVILAAAGVVFLTFYQVTAKTFYEVSQAAAPSNIAVTGVVNRLPTCLKSYLCYSITDQTSGESYYLFSINVGRPASCSPGDTACENNLRNTDLSRYVGQLVKIEGLLIYGRERYLVPRRITPLSGWQPTPAPSFNPRPTLVPGPTIRPSIIPLPTSPVRTPTTICSTPPPCFYSKPPCLLQPDVYWCVDVQ